MKGFSKKRFIIITVLLVLVILCSEVYISRKYDINQSSGKTAISTFIKTFQHTKEDVVVAVVACGDRLHETLTMLKSALMFSNAHLHFIVVAEENLIPSFNEKLNEWNLYKNFEFKVLTLTFPSDSGDDWRKLFKPCAAQRLFLPVITIFITGHKNVHEGFYHLQSVLNETDAILYVDTDTLFLTPVETVWRHFKNMNSSQMAALAPEHEDPNIGWYNRFARHPYYGKFGINSGVMLMNLTKMRQFLWVDYVVPIYKKYKLKITWGDQDIINIIFHFHPDKLYVYPCKYNFRPDHCMYMSVCKSAEKDGVEIIHGSRGFFHSTKQPVFQAIYQTFQEFHLGNDLFHGFYQPLEVHLQQYADTNCGHIKDSYLKNIRKYIVNNTYDMR